MKIQTINYEDYTKLPVKHVIRQDSSSSHLEITTPTGTKGISLTRISSGFLGGDNEVNLTPKEIISELKDIENETLDYLLQEWLKTLNK